MPKLSKIRLTGCKYDGLRKEHENSIFDLTKDGKADHTLFTLFNGGGKGVMMQLIFQLLLPETKWGKSNGNKIIGMFYDQRKNLHSFTFHVVLEWVLDTVPEKRLINGIAFKSSIKNTGSDEEESAGLNYFLYTYEHENDGYFTVENLPLYDLENKKAVELETLENFIDDNKRIFTKYSQSSARKKDGPYYSYLEDRGIYRSEWINLKSINKSEGGVGDYFIGANDNKSIFDKIILPAISENIRNYIHDGENNLIEMFKSNLSITKDLPVLIKRESSYKNLQEYIKPLIANADAGSRYIDRKNRLIIKGNNIYFTLKEEENFVAQEVEKLKTDLKRAEDEKYELAFKKDNLEYNQQRIKLISKENEVKKLEKQLSEKEETIKAEKESLKLYEINELLYEKKQTEQSLVAKTKEKESLIEDLDIKDIKDKAKSLDNAIELEWEKNVAIWKENERSYESYINYVQGAIEEYKNKKNNYELKIKELDKKIIEFDFKEKDLLKDKLKLESQYSLLSLEFPERILEDLNRIQNDIQENIEKYTEEIEDYNKRLFMLNTSIGILESKLEEYEIKMDKLNQEILKQEAFEKETVKKLSKILLENNDGSLRNNLWFSKKLEEIENKEKEKNHKLEEIQRLIWEKNIDRALNKYDFFIANKDITLVKEMVENLGIHVETGSEFIKELDDDAKLTILNDYPGFIYSVVIGSEKDWQLIETNIDKSIFLNNMVPIYIRSEMKGKNNLIKTLVNKAYKLIDENDYITWKDELTSEMSKMMEIQISIKNDILKISEIKQDLNIILRTKTTLELRTLLKEYEEEKQSLIDEIRIKKQEQLSIDNNLNQVRYALKEEDKKLVDSKKSIIEMKSYLNKSKELYEEKIIVDKIKIDILDLEKGKREVELSIEDVEGKRSMIKDSYSKWKLEIENDIKQIKDIFNKASYEFGVRTSELTDKIPTLLIQNIAIMSLVNQRKILEEDISSKNNNIALLDKDIKHLNLELKRHIDDLNKISKDWKDYPRLENSLNEIQIKISQLKIILGNLEIDRSSIKSSYDTSRGSILAFKQQLEAKENQIYDKHKKSVVFIEIQDTEMNLDVAIINIQSDMDIVSRDIQLNNKFYSVCIDGLEKYKDYKAKLDINIAKIKSIYTLDFSKGKEDIALKERIKENLENIIQDWLNEFDDNERKIKEKIDDGEKRRSDFIREINLKLEEDKLKEKVISTIKEANILNFKSNLISFTSMENHFQKELMNLSKDKQKAEEAMKNWTSRASIHIIRMIDSLKSMIASMNYTNDQGHIFPLVKLKGMERLPKEEAEIIYLLEEYFVQAISKILEKKEDISKIDDKVYKELMDDTVLFSKALQGRYPTLLVYKMTEKNEFRYARAREEYYTTWEAINKGEGDLPEGSGGQTLSVNTFVIMMIMSYKKKNIGNENPSTVLVLDNPFGKASAKHVLDPIFEIADKLNFQMICFAAPEIIKVEISERFPVFWELKLDNGKVIHGGRVIKT